MDDPVLISLVLSGDQRAFSRLFANYRDAHFRFAVRMLGSRFDADDALQSAWLRAFRHLHRCEDRTRFGSWIYSIVVNECRSAAMTRTRRERWFADDAPALDVAHDTLTEDGSYLREELEAAIAALEPLYREAFLLRHVEELGYDEMSRITGVGVSALKMRVKRACEQLRQLLQGVQYV